MSEQIKKEEKQREIDFRFSILEDPKSKKSDIKQAIKILKKEGVL